MYFHTVTKKCIHNLYPQSSTEIQQHFNGGESYEVLFSLATCIN